MEEDLGPSSQGPVPATEYEYNQQVKSGKRSQFGPRTGSKSEDRKSHGNQELYPRRNSVTQVIACVGGCTQSFIRQTVKSPLLRLFGRR